MPIEQRNGVLFFWLLLVTLVCIAELIYSWDSTIIGYKVKSNRGIYVLWNGEIDKQWQMPLSKKYGQKLWDLLFHAVLGGNDSPVTKELGHVFSGMSQKLINVDAILYFVAYFSVPKNERVSTPRGDDSHETIHFTKEQNDAYDAFLGKIFMNFSHSFPFFPGMVCVRHKEELQKMLSLLNTRLSKEMLPGETIVLPLYTRAKRSDDVQGPHRSYITFTVTTDSSSKTSDERFVDVSFYDTRTIHWALNPKGKDHTDKKGFVRVDYKHLPLDPQFEENFFDFFTTISRLPNGSYRRTVEETTKYNFEDYQKFMKLLFGEECEQIPEQQRKLQIYGTCSWEPLEKIIKDWSGDDKLLAQRFKLNFRRWIYNEVLRLERRGEVPVPKQKENAVQLLKNQVENQLKHDEQRLYEIVQSEKSGRKDVPRETA